MVESVVIAAAVIAAVFSFLALCAAAAAIVIVLGWKNSTHKIVQVPVESTRFEYDLPPDVTPDELPSPPEPLTREQYARKLREASLEELYEES